MAASYFDVDGTLVSTNLVHPTLFYLLNQATPLHSAMKLGKAVAKAPSACKGLEEATCKGKTECRWNSESKDKATGAVKRKAYCSAKPKPKAKTETK